MQNKQQNPQSSSPSKVLTLNNGKLSSNNPDYLKNIQKLSNPQNTQDIHLIFLGWNNNPLILPMLIKSNNFRMMQVLTLNGNKIVSVEGLQRLEIPQLVHLQICDNCIISLKPLRKVYMPKLRQLNLSSLKVIGKQNMDFGECEWKQLKALIVNFKYNIYTGIIKTNFQLDFAAYDGWGHKTPQFVYRRFPKTLPNDYNFLDLQQYL